MWIAIHTWRNFLVFGWSMWKDRMFLYWPAITVSAASLAIWVENTKIWLCCCINWDSPLVDGAWWGIGPMWLFGGVPCDEMGGWAAMGDLDVFGGWGVLFGGTVFAGEDRRSSVSSLSTSARVWAVRDIGTVDTNRTKMVHEWTFWLYCQRIHSNHISIGLYLLLYSSLNTKSNHL